MTWIRTWIGAGAFIGWVTITRLGRALRIALKKKLQDLAGRGRE